MPLYEYQCESCQHRFERIQKFTDPPPEGCPVCAAPVKKLFSSPAIQFKGSGFYITDYPKSSSGDSKSSGGSKESSSSDSGSSSSSASSASTASSSSTPSKDSKGSKDSTPSAKKD